ncbi:MAG TPA: hypothetical protein VHL79_01855 [Ramlibacter sp.]|jgi:hypothetical protein|nr:hypothetical protein [Ramlibacter sp.]
MNVEEAAQLLIRVVVIPLWIAAGLADWWCHRRTRIEATSGLPENVFHWALLAQGGVAVVAVALLEINAAVLVLVLAVFLTHEVSTFVELRYTVPLRDVRPGEQMVHSFMELLPLVMLALLAVAAWEEVVAIVTGGLPDWSLRLKEQPWPAGYLLGAAAAIALVNVVPMAEETLRCMRRGSAARSPRPTGDR